MEVIQWKSINNNVFYQVNNVEPNNASVDAKAEDVKFVEGKYIVDNVVVSLNTQNMKKSSYLEVITGISVTGKYLFTGVTLGNVIDHEGIHVTDYLLNGMAIKPGVNGYEQLFFNKNIITHKLAKTSVLNVEYPILEKRAMEQSEILNRINGESEIKRPFYTPDSIKSESPLF